MAEVVGLPLLPWQPHALDVGLEEEDGHWAYPDVAVAVARQNGKTGGVLHPRILTGLLLWGERILHSAQNRELPRESFLEIAEILETRFPRRLASRPRRANGQESPPHVEWRFLPDRRPPPRRPPRATPRMWSSSTKYANTTTPLSSPPSSPRLNTSKNPQVWWASNAGDPD